MMAERFRACQRPVHGFADKDWKGLSTLNLKTLKDANHGHTSKHLLSVCPQNPLMVLSLGPSCLRKPTAQRTHESLSSWATRCYPNHHQHQFRYE